MGRRATTANAKAELSQMVIQNAKAHKSDSRPYFQYRTNSTRLDVAMRRKHK